MKPIQSFAKLILKYGNRVKIEAPESPLDGTSFCAFIQPLRYKNKMYLDGTFSPIGYVDQAHYLYIGPPDVDITALDETACLVFGNKKYKFTRRETVSLKNTPVYFWSVLRAVCEEQTE